MRGLGTRFFGGSRVPVNRRSRGVGATAITHNAPIWSSGPNFTVTELVASANQSLPVYANGSPITITWIAPGSQPSWITFSTAQANPTITFTGGAGQVDSADISGMVLRATADGISVDSSSAGTGSVTITSASVTLTQNIGFDIPTVYGSEPFYNKAAIASDGMFAWWCVGSHGQSEDNGVHGFSPWETTKTDAAGNTRSARTGFWRWPNDIGHYVDQYDNRPHWNIKSANYWITPGNGVFNFATASWVAGNLSPSTQTWNGIVRQMSAADNASNLWNGGNHFNPMCVWVEALECLVMIGGEASSTPLRNFWKVERTLPSEGFSEPWKVTRYSVPAEITTMAQTRIGISVLRECAVAVGPYVYFLVESNKFWRLDARDMTSVTQLADWPTDYSSAYYFLMTYDERRKKILLMGPKVHSYDIDNNAGGWTDITPSNWDPAYGVMGEYHREMDAHYFRAYNGYGYGDNFGQFEKNAWHKLYLGNPTNNPRWRSQTVSASPFKGYIEIGYGQNKHVSMAWHPTKKRMYNCGGDFGYGSGAFGQPEGSSNNTTNQPSGARTYPWTDSLRMDMYSIDPLATGTQNWRLEHPYWPLNISSSPELKPGFTDQVGWVWDDRPSGSGGQKFWCFQHHIRDDQSNIPRYLADGVTLDPWANGDTFINSQGKIEGNGTYSWTPSASGGVGTWTKETTRYMWGDINYSSTPTVVGDALRIYGGSPDHLYCGAWTQYKAATDGRFISIFGDLANPPYTLWFVTFDPVAKTYAYRRLTLPSSLTWCDSRIAPIVCIDDYVYVTVATAIGSTRKSQILRVNVTTALATAASGTIPLAASTLLDVPFTFDPLGEWEATGGGGNIYHEVGLVGVDRKLILIGSYGGSLVKNGTTRLATYTPDTGRWLMADPFPGSQYNSKCWVAIPESGEIMMMPNSSGDDYDLTASPHSTYWYYRVR